MMLIADDHGCATAGSDGFEHRHGRGLLWPIARFASGHDLETHSCRDTSRSIGLIWWSLRAISFWLCKTASAGPLEQSQQHLGRRSQSGSTGRLRQNGQTRPKGALKDVELACEPWPAKRGWIRPHKKEPDPLGAGRSSVWEERCFKTSHQLPSADGGLPAVHLRRGHSPLTLATSRPISITNTKCCRLRFFY